MTGRPSIKAPRDEAPPAPWDPFPLTELMILGGIVLALLGLLIAGGARQLAMIAGGLVLIGLASAEFAFREHFAGHRSHTTLLAAIPAVIVASGLWLLANKAGLIPSFVAPIALVAVFALCFWRLRELFKRRSGGLGFRA